MSTLESSQKVYEQLNKKSIDMYNKYTKTNMEKYNKARNMYESCKHDDTETYTNLLHNISDLPFPYEKHEDVKKLLELNNMKYYFGKSLECFIYEHQQLTNRKL